LFGCRRGGEAGFSPAVARQVAREDSILLCGVCPPGKRRFLSTPGQTYSCRPGSRSAAPCIRGTRVRPSHLSQSARLWRHVIINTRGTWLHGDSRGFRNRKHRIHSSGAVERSMPGSIWAAGGMYKRVSESSHRRNVFAYILYGQGAEAWTWSFRDGTLEGQFGGCRADE